MNISLAPDKPHDIFRFEAAMEKAGGERERGEDGGGRRTRRRREGELTQHLIARHVGPGDTEGRIGVTVVSIDGQLPIVHAPREADAREDHAVLVALAGRAHRVLGYGHFLRYAGRAGRPREPRHCRSDTKGV